MIEKGQHNRPTSVIMGTNRDEGTLFTPRLAKVIPGLNYPIQENQFHMIIEHFFHNASLTNDVLTFYPWNQYANGNDKQHKNKSNLSLPADVCVLKNKHTNNPMEQSGSVSQTECTDRLCVSPSFAVAGAVDGHDCHALFVCLFFQFESFALSCFSCVDLF